MTGSPGTSSRRETAPSRPRCDWDPPAPLVARAGYGSSRRVPASAAPAAHPRHRPLAIAGVVLEAAITDARDAGPGAGDLWGGIPDRLCL